MMNSNDEKSEEFVMYLQHYRYYGFNLTLNQNLKMRFSLNSVFFLQCQHAKRTQT